MRTDDEMLSQLSSQVMNARAETVEEEKSQQKKITFDKHVSNIIADTHH